ncbi:MAG: DUF4432 family protein [Victivallales bacterium]|nr:DUF4432 family protein [Victivallales bacterium]
MKTFLGIGAGPIQTGIFVSGAFAGNFNRIVLADVDAELVAAIRKSGSITVNTAKKNEVLSHTYTNIEIYNPMDKEDLNKLIEIASEAIALATALPSTAFYRHLGWVRDAFAMRPQQQRYFYAAENSTTAARELHAAIGDFPQTYYLDTVIGKMSKIFSTEECALPPLAPGMTRGHLVEEFNTIYSNSAPNIEQIGIVGIYPKEELEPFEEAKLYGHNAVHFLLATLADRKGCRYMNEVVKYPELLRSALKALKEECGSALCKKFTGKDEFFTPEKFQRYADELITRMVSPVLKDSIERIIRDPERKLDWNDRIIGAIRLCLSQGINPAELAAGIVIDKDISAKWRQSADYDEQEGRAVINAIRNSAMFSYAGNTDAQLRNYLCDMEQIAYARMSTLAEGDGRGNRIIEVNNGSGLSFTVVPDRGMDIVEASFRGVPLAFRAPSGHVNAGRFEPHGFGWLRAWTGGLLTTCGLRHVGPPESDEDNPLDVSRGLHGRISSHSAEAVGISREWHESRYEIRLTGTLREAMMFGENLRLKRSISTAPGDNAIYIEDTVTNLGSTSEYIQILYHCNLGYPFVAPGTELQAVAHELMPRDDNASAGIADWHTMPEPRPGIKEQCFLHHIPPAADGWAEISAMNKAAGLKLTVSYDTATLPNLMQWKLAENGRYVMGLEPTNTTVSGRARDIASGVAPVLPPGETMTFRVRLTFSAS